jgi:hypothetical protein
MSVARHRAMGQTNARLRSLFDDSRRRLYLDRAAEVRRLAEVCENDRLKQQLLLVASEYETLARQIEEGTLRF